MSKFWFVKNKLTTAKSRKSSISCSDAHESFPVHLFISKNGIIERSIVLKFPCSRIYSRLATQAVYSLELSSIGWSKGSKSDAEQIFNGMGSSEYYWRYWSSKSAWNSLLYAERVIYFSTSNGLTKLSVPSPGERAIVIAKLIFVSVCITIE